MFADYPSDRESRIKDWQAAVAELRALPPAAKALRKLEKKYDLSLPTAELAAILCDKVIAGIILEYPEEIWRKAEELIGPIGDFRIDPLEPTVAAIEHPEVRLQIAQAFKTLIESEDHPWNVEAPMIDDALDPTLIDMDLFDHRQMVGAFYFSESEAEAAHQAITLVHEILNTTNRSIHAFRHHIMWRALIVRCQEALQIMTRYPFPNEN